MVVYKLTGTFLHHIKPTVGEADSFPYRIICNLTTAGAAAWAEALVSESASEQASLLRLE
jgi:hypothetical protein